CARYGSESGVYYYFDYW
nr:immunoglobulin heavy chain junction region [Macaca mulatta]MOX93276.1 immunoglobulin heavy chain junction region [Macaca mulatta]MOX93457.1 immunoglobulin heavy chain junction region [Macaca mulatta]MOX93867.1 immunoglobulin heavy chain junction region [Macaca mulatta]MOX94419.1 immunoglobulin heavy chain junction region [Macaca mulatta]